MQMLTPEQMTELQAEVRKLAQELVSKIVTDEIVPLRLELRKVVADLTKESANLVALTDKRSREIGGIINQRLEPINKQLQDHTEHLDTNNKRIERLVSAQDVIKGQAAQAAKSVGCVDAKLHILDSGDKAQAAQLTEHAKSVATIINLVGRVERLEERAKVRHLA